MAGDVDVRRRHRGRDRRARAAGAGDRRGARRAGRSRPTTIHYVGAQRGIETALLPPTPFPHTFLDVVGLQRRLNVANIRLNAALLPKLAAAARQARALLRRLRPQVVVSVGGYASLPAVFAARRLTSRRRRQLRPPPRSGVAADRTARRRVARSPSPTRRCPRAMSPALRSAARCSPSTAVATGTRRAPSSACPSTASWSPSRAVRWARVPSTRRSPSSWTSGRATPSTGCPTTSSVTGSSTTSRPSTRRGGILYRVDRLRGPRCRSSTPPPTCWSGAGERARSTSSPSPACRRSSCRGPAQRRGPPDGERPLARRSAARRCSSPNPSLGAARRRGRRPAGRSRSSSSELGDRARRAGEVHRRGVHRRRHRPCRRVAGRVAVRPPSLTSP